jgi:coproporphyrinogen III oxidase
MKGPWNVYLVKPDDGRGQTMAMPNGEVFEAVEVHPDHLCTE